MIGVVVHSCGFVAASFASTILHLYWTQGVMIGVGISFMFVSDRMGDEVVERPGVLNRRRYHLFPFFLNGSIRSAHWPRGIPVEHPELVVSSSVWEHMQ